MTVPPPPTLAGFIAWSRTVMGVTTTILPDNSVWFVYAYDVAITVVLPALAAAGASIYTLAVYNLAGSNLLNFAQDLPDAAMIQGSDPPAPFFAYARTKFNINGFVSGVVTSASDESTSDSLLVPDAFKGLTISDLQALKDPYGRVYLGFAQRYGLIWGLT